MNIHIYVCSDIDTGQTIESALMVDGCHDPDSRIDHLEHVQVWTHFILFLHFTFSVNLSILGYLQLTSAICFAKHVCYN